MILGMSLSTFTTFHVILSLVGIVSGLVVLFGMFGSKKMPGCTAIFLLTTVLTSATGFLFPRGPLLPSHIVGIVSLVILADRDYRVVRRQACGLVAMDLRGHGGDRSVPERIRPGCAAIRQVRAAQKARTDAIGAAVCHRARDRVADIHLAVREGSAPISSCTAALIKLAPDTCFGGRAGVRPCPARAAGT